MGDYKFIKKQVPPLHRACDVFAHISNGGQQEGAILFETADGLTPDSGKSLLMLSPCLRIEGYATRVVVTPLTLNGQFIVQRVAEKTAAAELTANALVLRYPRQLDAENESERLQQASSLSALRDVLQELDALHDEERKLFTLAGLFHFECVEMFESFTAFNEDGEALLFKAYLPEIIVAMPRADQSATLHALVTQGENAVKIENEMGRQLVALAEQLKSVAAIQPAKGLLSSGIETDVSDAEFKQRVSQVKEHLRAGDAFQIVISRRFFLPCTDALAAYQTLRAENPSPYLFYLNLGDAILIGASPESAVKVNGLTREVEVCPIAGTRQRGRNENGEIDADFDARIEADLRADEKEVAEHMMLVDLARNDVARISKPGTRKVKQLLTVERYSRVMHLVSRVSGELKVELDAVHAYAASMPMGTLSGAPKIKAIEIIRQMEGKRRNAYGGAVGYVNARGDMDTAIVIRSALIRNGLATIQAGAGVVMGSDPVAEADETRRKAESVLRAIHGVNVAQLGAEHA